MCADRVAKKRRHGNSFIDVQRVKAPFDHDSLHSFCGFLSSENMQNIRCAAELWREIRHFLHQYTTYFIDYRFDVIGNIRRAPTTIEMPHLRMGPDGPVLVTDAPKSQTRGIESFSSETRQLARPCACCRHLIFISLRTGWSASTHQSKTRHRARFLLWTLRWMGFLSLEWRARAILPRY